MISTSVNNYVMQKSLWAKAEQNMKQPAKPSGDSTISNLTAQLNDVNEQNKFSAVMTKMRTGKRLTAAEKEYLRKKSPEMYEKYQKIEAERASHRRQLKRAKSEKEATQIQQMKMAAFYGECKAAGNAGDSDYAMCRAAAINSEYGEYKARARKPGQENEQRKGDTLSISRRTSIPNAIKDGVKPSVQKLWKKKPESVNEALRKKAFAGYQANR